MGNFRGQTKRQQARRQKKAQEEFDLFLGVLALPLLPFVLLFKLFGAGKPRK